MWTSKNNLAIKVHLVYRNVDIKEVKTISNKRSLGLLNVRRQGISEWDTKDHMVYCNVDIKEVIK